jgi:hypothetical protein
MKIAKDQVWKLREDRPPRDLPHANLLERIRALEHGVSW